MMMMMPSKRPSKRRKMDKETEGSTSTTTTTMTTKSAEEPDGSACFFFHPIDEPDIVVEATQGLFYQHGSFLSHHTLFQGSIDTHVELSNSDDDDDDDDNDENDLEECAHIHRCDSFQYDDDETNNSDSGIRVQRDHEHDQDLASRQPPMCSTSNTDTSYSIPPSASPPPPTLQQSTPPMPPNEEDKEKDPQARARILLWKQSLKRSLFQRQQQPLQSSTVATSVIVDIYEAA